MRLAKKALTFDDVLLVPAYSEILPRDTSLRTRLTRRIGLNIPLVSAAMDTVTEGRLAIAIAQEGAWASSTRTCRRSSRRRRSRASSAMKPASSSIRSRSSPT